MATALRLGNIFSEIHLSCATMQVLHSCWAPYHNPSPRRIKIASPLDSQIPLCQRMLGSNPGMLLLGHWQSDALFTQLDLIHKTWYQFHPAVMYTCVQYRHPLLVENHISKHVRASPQRCCSRILRKLPRPKWRYTGANA